MRKISFRFLVLFAAATSVFVLATSSVAADGAPNDSKATALKNEILRGYENYFKNIDDVEITTDFEYALDGELSTQRSRFIKSGPNILWEQDGRVENGTIIYGINKDYFFILVDENGKRVLDTVEKIDSPLAEKDFIAPRPWGSLREGQAKEYAVAHFSQCAGFGYALSHCWAFGLLDSPSFSVDSYEETTTDDGEKIVEVTFSNEPTAYFNERAGRLDPANIRGGRLEFLPDRYWQIRSGSVVFWDGETDYTMEWTNEFSGSPDAIPYELTFANRRLDMDYRYACDVKCARLAAPPDDSRFTLSHYGLPEPDFGDSSDFGDSRSNWTRLLCVLFGVAAVVFVVGRICRKRRVVAGALFVFAVLAFAFPARADDSARDKFVAEVIAQHRVIADSFQPNTVVATGKASDAPDVPAVSVEVSYQRWGTEAFSYSDGATVEALNPRYEFRLKKSGAEKSWEVSKLNPIATGEPSIFYACLAAWNKFQHFLYVADVPLAWILSQNALYEITDFQEVTRSDETTDTILRLKINEPDAIYRDNQATKYATDIGFESVEIKFNVEKYGYIPYEYTIEQHGASSATVFGDFAPILGTSVPVKMSSRVVLKDGTAWDNAVLEYRYEQKPECDESHFTLSHYGLPEPDFGESRSNWGRIFLIALGVAAIGFALRRICCKANVKKEIAQ